VAYFTAVLARSETSWRVRDVEVDDAQSLDDLADALRGVAVGNLPVLAVVEHEDEWFALVRIDGEDEPRLFVSDLGAASRSAYAEILAAAADADSAEDGTSGEDDAAADGAAVWAGESDLLDDLGVSAKGLRALVESNADDPGAVLGEVGDIVGFGDLLEALR
jgi:putative tRNA adenosine deaminase-associated protein